MTPLSGLQSVCVCVLAPHRLGGWVCVQDVYWYALYIVAACVHVCPTSTYSSTCLELFVCHMSV